MVVYKTETKRQMLLLLQKKGDLELKVSSKSMEF